MDLRELLNGDAARLRYIRRFTTCHVMHPETVAEHCWYTAYIALMITYEVALNLDIRGHDLLKLENMVVRQALLHDIEETRTGDLYRPFKVKHPAVKAAVEVAACAEARDIFEKLWPDCTPLARACEKAWRIAKQEDTRAGCIVAFADFLSIVAYLSQEAEVTNSTLARHIVELREYGKHFLEPQFEFLGWMPLMACEILEEMFR